MGIALSRPSHTLHLSFALMTDWLGSIALCDDADRLAADDDRASMQGQVMGLQKFTIGVMPLAIIIADTVACWFSQSHV